MLPQPPQNPPPPPPAKLSEKEYIGLAQLHRNGMLHCFLAYGMEPRPESREKLERVCAPAIQMSKELGLLEQGKITDTLRQFVIEHSTKSKAQIRHTDVNFEIPTEIGSYKVSTSYPTLK